MGDLRHSLGRVCPFLASSPRHMIVFVSVHPAPSLTFIESKIVNSHPPYLPYCVYISLTIALWLPTK